MSTLIARANVTSTITPCPIPMRCPGCAPSPIPPAASVRAGAPSCAPSAPRLFRRLPETLRLRATKRHLGPAPGWFMRGKLTAQHPAGPDHRKRARRCRGRRADVRMARTATHQIVADHVIAATGYRPDLRRLTFLDWGLRDADRPCRTHAASVGPFRDFGAGAVCHGRAGGQHLRPPDALHGGGGICRAAPGRRIWSRADARRAAQDVA